MLLALTKPLAMAGTALWIGIPTIAFSSSGFWSSPPANFSSSGLSCSTCHSLSAPSVDSSRTTLRAPLGVHALNAGQAIQITTALDASGVNLTYGGFICEATDGAFTAGANSTTMNGVSTIAISHSSDQFRSWTYGFTAPAAAGLVELTSAALSVDNNSSTTNDYFSFSGFDKTATSATPLRLFVLPTGVTNIGTSCSDGYGNMSVLGANNSPTVGNAGFELQLHGAAPGSMAFAWGSIGAGGFSSSLNSFGLNGCTAYIQTVGASQTAITGGGLAVRAEGSATFALPIPNNPALIGSKYHVQSGYFDTSVSSAVPAGSTVAGLPRSLDLSFTNGLEITIQ